MAATFESLPLEVREMIFTQLRINSFNTYEDGEVIGSKSTIYLSDPILGCLLVCKSWCRLFQTLLYSNIVLKLDYSQVPKLVNTLEGNQQLKQLVKRITFDFEVGRKGRKKLLAFEKLFILLPNLEYIDCSENWTFYSPVLSNALQANQLPLLTHIAPPIFSKDNDSYEACAIVLKDRLKNLTISEAFDDEDECCMYFDDEEDEDEDENFYRRSKTLSLHFHRLFNKLDQFKAITELHVTNKTDKIIHLIEEATKNCPSLQQLHFNTLTYINNKCRDDKLSNAIISNPLPASNVKLLNFQGGIVLYNSQLMQYIINKFPRLNTLRISGTTKRTDLDHEKLNQFLIYLTRIKKVTVVNIPFLNHETFVNSVGPFWSALSQSHVVFVEFTHLNTGNNNNVGKMKVEIKEGRAKIIITDRYGFCLKNTTLFENYGRYIDELKFSRINSKTHNPLQQAKIESYERIIGHPLKHCSNLKKLTISQSEIELSDLSDKEISKRFSLDHLKLHYCDTSSDVMEKIVDKFSHIKRLELTGMFTEETVEFDNTGVRFNLMNTDIDILSLAPVSWSLSGVFGGGPIYLLDITMGEITTYYIYDPMYEDEEFLPADKKEYLSELDSEECLLITICCKSLKKLEMNYSGEKASLTVSE